VSPEIPYELEEVEELPRRRFIKGSKYDAILDDFLSRGAEKALLKVPGVAPNYLATQLRKRIKAKPEYEGIKVAVISNQVYLIKE